MKSTVNPGRVAGFLYLLLIIIGPIRLIYIPNTLIVSGNAIATSQKIAAHELLFRFGIAGDLVGAVILVFLALVFYRLFEAVDKYLAVLVVITGGVMPATIYFLNVLNDAATLILVRGADYLSAFQTPQRDALAMLFLQLHYQVVVGAEILWGLWLLPLAALVYKSGFLPRFLGVWLFINGIGWIARSFAGLLLPQYDDVVANVFLPASLGEIAFMLWLVIRGARPPSAERSEV